MKICYDTLEGVYLTKKGTFRKGRSSYVYKESCCKCGKSFLTLKCRQSNFCCTGCALKGKKLSLEHKQNISKKTIGRKLTENAKLELSKRMKGENNHMFGIRSPNYKGDVTRLNLALYNTYANQLSFVHQVRRDPKNKTLLQVRCVYCGCWTSPTRNAVRSRVKAINKGGSTECLFYCSDNCKNACPIYKRIKYPKGFRPGTSREVQSELRKLVLERDKYECQICGKGVDEVELHCHHITGIKYDPIESADIDNCISLCKYHHSKVHQLPGCGYNDLKCFKKEQKYG